MEKQKTESHHHNIEEEQSWRTDTPWLQDLLKRYRNQDCDIGKRIENRSMGQNRELSNKPT